MALRVLPRPRSPGLRRTALLVLVTFGPVACFWKTVPLTSIESGEEKVEGVTIRVHRPGVAERQELEVSRLDFPYVEGQLVKRSEVQSGAPAPSPGAVETVEVRAPGAPARIDLREVDEIEVYTPARGVVGVIAGLIGGALAVLLAILIVVALTKQSCPFVYVVGPAGPTLVGESYSGATARALQRDDLMPLPALGSGRARLLLTNEALEQQLTDRLELVGVEGPAGVHALATAQAQLVLASGNAAPLRALDLEGADVTALVATDDRRAWETDLEAAAARPEPPRSGVEARFAAPPGQPVLEVDLANTAFLDAVTGRFFAAIDPAWDEVRARESAPGWADEVWRWREREGVDLLVELWRGDRWAPVGVIPTVGAAGLRRVAVVLPPGGGEEVRVRLSGGAGFWRVDRMALSTLRDASPRLVRLAPAEARDQTGADVRPLLATVDGRHQVMRRTGERVELAFELPPAGPGAERSWFLLTTGYYLVDRPARPAPSPRTAQALWEEPGAFRRFALDLYREYRAVALRAPAPARGTP